MNNLTKTAATGILYAISLVIMIGTVHAQNTNFRDQAWRYGVNLGWNFNSASLGYQNLHEPFPNFNAPNREHMDNVNGKGSAVYGGVFLEYLSESWWGVQLRASYDLRNAIIKDPYPTPNTEFNARMSYLSFEPALRVDQHMIPNLSLTAGPLVAVNIHGTYDFKADANGPVTDENVKVPDRNVASLGLTAGVAYDIELNRSHHTSFFLSPFFDYSWIASQRKSVLTSTQNSSNDIWSTQTFRVGLRLSWESRNAAEEKVTEVPAAIPRYVDEARESKKATFIGPVNNRVMTKNIKGYYPILPYVFYDKGSRSIPSKYVMLSKTDAQNFRESDLTNFKEGDMTVQETNVRQLMSSYYHVMNIYADRMRKDRTVVLTLRGCDPLEVDGQSYADQVKNYLVDIWGIDPKRIVIEVEPPMKPSGSAFTDPAFAGLIDDENRRAGFVFSSDKMYRPLTYNIRDAYSIENDLLFSISDGSSFKSWNLAITGENGTMEYGPFETNSARINSTPLMNGLREGKFSARITIAMHDGSQTTENIDFALKSDPSVRNASRYLMLFDYNKSDALADYESKIRSEITPGMNTGNTVIIHGHTDIIGNVAGNQKLSQERAEQGKRIVEDELGKGDKKINVQAIGIGQTQMQYTFENKNPEGRMYNRNVFVEVIE